MLAQYTMLYSYLCILQVFKKRYLLATCGGIENQPAKIELFKCEEDVAKFKKLETVSFSKVFCVHHQRTADMKEIIVLTLDNGRQFSFYPESDTTEIKTWSKYCLELYRIPNHSIPELPNSKKIKSMKLGKCNEEVTKKLNACMSCDDSVTYIIIAIQWSI